ncbi:glycosyltransferase [Herbiconiux sp. P17]|uniref:glycosyltransferase n=1 Tax=Herbiconiux wuyangfengii TaxID=3342794 RepID=UPI0035B87FE3
MVTEGRRKSVAIIGTRGYPSYYGGFETAVRKLAPYLVNQGWDVTVYGRDGSTKDDDPERDPRVHTVKTRGLESKSVSTLSYGFSASLHAARTKPDVALVMNVANGFFLPLLKLRGVKTLVNVDGIEWDRAKWGGLAKFVFRLGAKLTARFADEIVVDSHEIGRRWNVDFGRDGAFIPYGGDVPPDLPVEPDLTHRGYVLVVARFVPENTIPEFLEAAESLSADFPVVIVGSSGYGGELDDQVRALAETHENIRWYGHLSDDRKLYSLWQHAGVYFHGHSVGGTNPTLVQAMATSTPIVARDTVYNREVLGSAGVFAAPEPNSIREAITALMNDPDEQEQRSAASYQRSRSIYTWESVCSEYSSELTHLAESRPQQDRAKASKISD